MTTQAKAVLDQALRLDAVERAELIEALYRSFEGADPGPAEMAWREEAESRVDAYEAGEIADGAADDLLERLGKR
jgi:putative addiction module component (TIGR02574 family)